MNKNLLVSIVIPAYNAEKTIKKTIISVLEQTYKNFELIIVDDNSKDNTINIINSFSDSRLTFYKNSFNLGFEDNWNEALSKAKGEYIKVLPDDDTLEINAIKLQVEILEKYHNVVLVGSKRNIIDKDDKIIMTRGKALSKNNFCKYKEAIKKIFQYGTNPIGEPGSVLFRASVISNTIKFDALYPHYIDLDFYLKILKYGDYYFIDNTLSNFRIWERSYSVSNKKDNFNESKKFFKKLKNTNSFLTNTDYIICNINVYKNMFLKQIFYYFVFKLK